MWILLFYHQKWREILGAILDIHPHFIKGLGITMVGLDLAKSL